MATHSKYAHLPPYQFFYHFLSPSIHSSSKRNITKDHIIIMDKLQSDSVLLGRVCGSPALLCPSTPWHRGYHPLHHSTVALFRQERKPFHLITVGCSHHSFGHCHAHC